jgi:hypothetical protein
MLTVVRQTSLVVERYTRNGVKKNVHVVVKEKPYLVELALDTSAQIETDDILDFNKLTIEAQLVYDSPGEREVDCIKVRPFEYIGTLGDNPQSFTLEVKFFVLSSQHEDQHFKLRISARRSSSHEKVLNTIYSEPIKIISKPSVVIKDKPPRSLDCKRRTPDSPSSSCDELRPPAEKRAKDDAILELLASIQRQQAEQQKFLERLYEERQQLLEPLLAAAAARSPTMSCCSSPGTGSPVCSPSSPLVSSSTHSSYSSYPAYPSPDFESAFRSVLAAFYRIPPEQRADRVRQFLAHLGESAAFSQLLELVWSENLIFPSPAVVGDSTPVVGPTITITATADLVMQEAEEAFAAAKVSTSDDCCRVPLTLSVGGCDVEALLLSQSLDSKNWIDVEIA